MIRLQCASMDFITKKIFSAILLPFPTGLLFILLGLVLLCATRCKKIAGASILVGFLILALFGCSPFTFYLVNSLERQSKPLVLLPDNITKIVVLGGGVRGDTRYPPNTQLNSASLARLIEAVRLYHLYQQRGQDITLVFSGGRVFGSPTEAGIMQNTAILLGVDKKDILLEDGSEDTYQEAKYLLKNLKKQPFILVTSAIHMPRAIMLFESFGMHPIPAPTQYLGKQQTYNINRYFPNTSSLSMGDAALHELEGIWWWKLQQYRKHQ